jgi:putative transposase
MDNVFIERLWRSLKYEDVYNDRRPHQALADRMPMAVWREVIVGARAVDMMDNASALPTCPQPQQQTQPLAA